MIIKINHIVYNFIFEFIFIYLKNLFFFYLNLYFYLNLFFFV
jgi:hypothetical protein